MSETNEAHGSGRYRNYAMTRRALGFAAAALTALAASTALPATAIAASQPERTDDGWLINCPPIGWMTSTGLTDQQTWAINNAVEQISLATGQDYRYDGTTDWVPQHGQTNADPDDVVIAALPMAYDSTIFVAVPADSEGAVEYQIGDIHAGIVLLLNGLTPPEIQELAMHELALARQIPERDDPGGLLGHTLGVPGHGPVYFSTADQASLAGTGCLR